MAFFNTNVQIDLTTFNLWNLFDPADQEEFLDNVNAVFDSTDLPGVPAPFTASDVAQFWTGAVDPDQATYLVALLGEGFVQDANFIPLAGTVTGLVVVDRGDPVLGDLWTYAIGFSAALLDVYNAVETFSDNSDDLALLQQMLSGADTMLGSDFDDVLFSGAANDSIEGNGGNDALNGEGGNDILAGGDGDDDLTGGAGADTLDGGAGFDLARYLTSSVGLRIDLGVPSTNTGDAAGDTFVSIEGIDGSDFNDTLLGDSRGNYLGGWNGNDNLSGLGGADDLWGDDGNDSLYGGEGNDVLIGGNGADLLDGGVGARDLVRYIDSATGLRVDLQAPATNTGIAAGDSFVGIEDLDGSNNADSLLGNAVANIISGANGDDVLFGRDGADTLDGGNGNDILYGGVGADIINGGSGTRDRVMYSDSATGLRVDLQTPGANTGIAAGDTFLAIEDLYGSNFADSLLGNAGGNMIWGAAGNDALYGRDGADSLYGGDGNDLLYGGTGADRLDGGNGTRDRAMYSDSATGLRVDLLSPGANTGIAAGDTFVGVEDLYGSNQADSLLGDTGGNILWGANGNDALYGRDGADSLYGGDGNDLLYGGVGADLLDGGAGTRDRAMYSDSATGLRADLQLAATNTGIAAGDTYLGVEDLFGSNAADSLLGNTGGNILWGANGNDVIYGRDGADTLYGGAGNDVLYGGNGLDRLEGGAGADSFVFNTALAGSVDTIADFSVVDDRILLENAIFTALTATGALAGTAFATGAAATTAAHRVIYNSATGQLLYDADGSGAGAAVHFATLSTGLAVTAADFVVV